ncbi:MAG: BrnA antitoxin family protein [Sphingorhabdus sp.]
MTDTELKAHIERLVAMPDNAIDTVDIPEAPAENWKLAKRPDLHKPLKKPVTLRLDSDVVNWFKDHARSGGYQTEINRVLRRYVQTRKARG